MSTSLPDLSFQVQASSLLRAAHTSLSEQLRVNILSFYVDFSVHPGMNTTLEAVKARGQPCYIQTGTCSEEGRIHDRWGDTLRNRGQSQRPVEGGNKSSSEGRDLSKGMDFSPNVRRSYRIPYPDFGTLRFETPRKVPPLKQRCNKLSKRDMIPADFHASAWTNGGIEGGAGSHLSSTLTLRMVLLAVTMAATAMTTPTDNATVKTILRIVHLLVSDS